MNILLILTGKTASGKDSVMSRLLSKMPNYRRVITTTSRLPRPGENNEVDYYFISKPDFQEKINNEEFIEYVNYGGNFYGTEKKEILHSLQANLIWRIDPSRAGQIRKFITSSFDQTQAAGLLSRVLVVYLTTQDQVILKRLKNRGLSEYEISSRLQDDRNFWQIYRQNYDFVVENVPGQLNQTVDKITKIIENHNSS